MLATVSTPKPIDAMRNDADSVTGSVDTCTFPIIISVFVSFYSKNASFIRCVPWFVSEPFLRTPRTRRDSTLSLPRPSHGRQRWSVVSAGTSPPWTGRSLNRYTTRFRRKKKQNKRFKWNLRSPRCITFYRLLKLSYHTIAFIIDDIQDHQFNIGSISNRSHFKLSLSIMEI